MSTDTKNAEQPLKNPKLSAEQSSHKSPSATSPSFRKQPRRTGYQSPTRGSSKPVLPLTDGDNSESSSEDEAGRLIVPIFDLGNRQFTQPKPPHRPGNNPLFSLHVTSEEQAAQTTDNPFNSLSNRLTDTDDTMSEPSMHASDPDPTVVLEPSLDMELARAKPARQDENPHLRPVPVSYEHPSDLLTFKSFTPNIGQFERIAPGVSFLRQGHSDNILNAASRDPGYFAAVVPLMGGKEIFAKRTDGRADITVEIVKSLEDAGFTPIFDFSPKLEKEEMTRVAPGSSSSTQASAFTGEMHNTRDMYARPNAAIIKVKSADICHKLTAPQTYAVTPTLAYHLLPFLNNTIRNWVVGHFSANLKIYDSETRATFLFMIKAQLFKNTQFRTLISKYTATEESIDVKMMLFLDTLDLIVQDSADEKLSKRWILYGAPVTKPTDLSNTSYNLVEQLTRLEEREREIRKFICEQTYAYDLFELKGTHVQCNLCKAQTHNRPACPFPGYQDWRGPTRNDTPKSVQEGSGDTNRLPRRGRGRGGATRATRAGRGNTTRRLF